MYLRIFSLLFGIGFVFLGVAGFFPSFMVNGLLLGYLSVDLLHNLIHILTGVVAILAFLSFSASRIFLRLFGIIYALMAFWGFWKTGGDMSAMPMPMNMADNVFHLVVAFFFLLLGFST